MGNASYTTHFSMNGEGLTNLLRQLWLEDEKKTVQLWIAAFPEFNSIEDLRNSPLLDIVQRRAKFIGNSDEGFKLIEDIPETETESERLALTQLPAIAFGWIKDLNESELDNLGIDNSKEKINEIMKEMGYEIPG